MIKFFRSWCEGIIVAVIISLIIETLLPEGNIKKYVKVIVGVFIIYTILSPFFGKIDTEIDFKSMNLASIETSSNIENSKSIQDIYTNGIKESLKFEIEENFDYKIENLDITYDENYENINEIIVKIWTNNVSEIKKVEIGNTINEKTETNELYIDVRDFICKNYNLDKSKVIIY